MGIMSEFIPAVEQPGAPNYNEYIVLSLPETDVYVAEGNGFRAVAKVSGTNVTPDTPNDRIWSGDKTAWEKEYSKNFPGGGINQPRLVPATEKQKSANENSYANMKPGDKVMFAWDEIDHLKGDRWTVDGIKKTNGKVDTVYISCETGNPGSYAKANEQGV